MLIYLLSLPLDKERPEVGGSWEIIFILLCQKKSSLAGQTDKIHSHSPKSPSLRSFPLRRCSGCFLRPERSRSCGVGSQHSGSAVWVHLYTSFNLQWGRKNGVRKPVIFFTIVYPGLANVKLWSRCILEALWYNILICLSTKSRCV